MPTTVEWARFKKYARRMRELKFRHSEEPVPLDVFSALQLRTLNEPLLPNLRTLEFSEVTADIIPFIPLFLSRRTIDIVIQFTTIPPAVMTASMIINLPILCPYMQTIFLGPLPLDSTITNAVSEMLLACNLDTLRDFQVNTPLTKEAYRVIYRLPNLRTLWSTILDPASLPKVSLPNLTELVIVYYYGYDWLQAFDGATLSKLTAVAFRTESEPIGNFLEAFEDVALATSASTTLTGFSFYTSCSWNPNYYSLLSFKHLKQLVIEFSCRDGCSSRVDDEIIIALAQAMPKLETLLLGKAPCKVPSNVTVHGLVALAHHCPDLSRLRVHFETDSFIVAGATEAVPPPSDGGLHPPPESCALANLEVGEIPIPQPFVVTVILILLRIFPRLLDIEYVDEGWKWVAGAIRLSKQIDTFVRHSGEIRPPSL